MAWTIELSKRANKQLDRLSAPVRARILAYLHERLAHDADPRRLGSALSGAFAGLWRWRVGDYRVLGIVEIDRVVIAVVAIDHRKQVYR